MNTPDPALHALLASLQPNTLPNAPSAWPWALGYWLILAVILIIVAMAIWFLQRQIKLKPLRQEIERIKQLPSLNQQLQQIHTLLRWLLINRQGAAKNLSTSEFKSRVNSVLSGQNIEWVNAHYDNKEVIINWQQVDKLITAWQKEARS